MSTISFTKEESTDESDSEGEDYLINIGAKSLSASLFVNSRKVKFHIDTGADVNTIGRKNVFSRQLKPTNRQLVMWNGTKVKPLGCINVADDIVVFGKTEAEHNDNMKELQRRCRERNIILNEEKACLKKTEIDFLGHTIGKDGLKPDTNKVRAILEMPEPKDVSAVRRFCGIIQYLARFMPNLSRTAEPLRALTRKDAEFNWTERCQASFKELKQKVAEAATLKFFNPDEPLALQVDSSNDGMGAVLLQKGVPIEYASRSLTKTQQKWAQIEKETLAVVFGLERFHQYTYGRQVTIENDHKPLETILNKPLGQAPKRLQNLMMRINRYSIKFQFVPGKDLKLADALSRACLKESEEVEEQFINCIQIRDATMDKIQCATEKDKGLQELKSYVKHGWPDKQTLRPELKPYSDIQDCISIDKEVLLKGDRVIIPLSLRSEMKDKLHRSHLGYDSMTRRARETVYWPGINRDLKQLAESCDACQINKPSNQKEPLKQHEEGNRPWQKVGLDFFEIGGRQYLLIVDYFSGFIEVEHMQLTTTTHTVLKLKQQFARFGIPNMIISDNGPQFSSGKFKEFTEKWNIIHKTSSPGNPRSNGKAEAAVKVIKSMMKRAANAETDPYEGLLELRNTPKQETGLSPAQIMFGRKTRSLLPSIITRRSSDYTDMQEKRQKRRLSTKTHYDKTSAPLPKLAVGQRVYYEPFGQNSRKWLSGTIESKPDFRSYIIKGDNGGKYRRNRRYIKPSFCPPSSQFSQTPKFSMINDDNLTPSPTSANAKEMIQQVPHSQRTHQQDQSTGQGDRGGDTTRSRVELPGSPTTDDFSNSPIHPDQRSAGAHPDNRNKHTITKSGRVVRKPNKYTC
ncbi:hypothetical protein EGW08_002270 [Elysia chlorotica]|uniref:Integrase catalytic domain-containing protein n=1 Tax=Elysia chlorotica TaxID=188477 RepID=A0A3S1BJW3_ELYCH|nr:hypothetical protein EGW08_002270 [Elysia chlorotica]